MLMAILISMVLSLAAAPVLFGAELIFDLPIEVVEMLYLMTALVIYAGYTVPAMERAKEQKEVRVRRSRFAVVETLKDKGPPKGE